MRKPDVALAFYYPKKRKTKPGLLVQDETYDFRARRNLLTRNLRTSCEDINFIPVVLHSQEDVVKLASRQGEFDGFVVYKLGFEYMRWIYELPLAETGKPLILIDDYLESYSFNNYLLMRRNGLPVVWMCSSRFEDVANTVKLLEVIHKMKHAKILLLIEEDRKTHIFGFSIEKFKKALKKLFGTEIVRMTKEEFLKNYAAKVSQRKAEAIADGWIGRAERVVEPTRDEVVKSAKVYLAIKRAIEEKKVDAFTTDISGYYHEKWPDDVFKLFYPDKDPKERGRSPSRLLTFPCMAFVQLQTDGFPATGEMNLHAVTNILVMHYLTEAISGEPRSGFTGGRLFDLGTGCVIYHLCCAPRKFFGPSGPECPYVLRTEQECASSCTSAIQMPTGEKITALSIDPEKRALIIHQGTAVKNITEERRCRNKLAIETNLENLINNNLKKNWPHGYHRTIFYGDWRKHLMNLAILTNMEVFEEDRA